MNAKDRDNSQNSRVDLPQETGSRVTRETEQRANGSNDPRYTCRSRQISVRRLYAVPLSINQTILFDVTRVTMGHHDVLLG